MDTLASQTIEMTIHDIWMCLEELGKEGDLSVTVANQIKAFKFELNYARLSLLGDYPSLHEPIISWVNLVTRDLIQSIRIGRMPAALLEETLSSLLQTIDDCPTIDNIYKCLEELENKGDLSVKVENQIQNLKFELRNLRIHSKWQTFYNFPVSCEVRARVKDVEQGLLQPIRKGNMTLDFLEEKLSSLLPSMKLRKNVELSALWFHAEHGWDPAGCSPVTLDFSYPDVLTDELVLEWIDPLIENIKHLIRRNDLDLVDFPKEQFEALVEKLRFLRNFLEITGTELEEVIKNVTPKLGLLHKTSEDLLIRIKWLIQNAIYVSLLSWAEEDNRWIRYFMVLLAKLNHIEPEIRMIYVQFLKASEMENQSTLGNDLRALAAVDSLLQNLQKLLKDQGIGSIMRLDVQRIEFLHQELSFLKYFLMDPHVKQQSQTKAQSFNSLLIQVEAIVREIGASLTHSICIGQLEDHMADEMNLLYSDLLKILNLIKTKIRQMYWQVPKPSTSTIPWTSKLGFLNFFMQNLEELLQYKADTIAYVKNEIETLHSELALLSSFIKDTIENLEEDDSTARAIMDVSYEAEQVIDLILASHFPRWYYMLWLSEAIEKIKTLRQDCTEVYSKKRYDISVLSMDKVSISDFPQAYTLATEEEWVGFQDEAEKIIDKLTRGSKKLQIVSIVGMPGLGKTTLAKKVYEHPLVSLYFHVRSWYCISQEFDRRDLLLSISGNVTESIREMDDEDMVKLIYKSLKGRRYLIVLDDIWSIEPWNDICYLFPDDCNGSRILFTSRIREVALQANPTSAPYDLRLFSDEESWELLKKKVFHQQNCPAELYTIGKQIAKNCKGLPLSVVLIAGVLKKLESEDHWKQVSESLGKQVVVDLSKFILELSYKHLPDHLKPCFLYFGVFPEDKDIPIWKLIRLWIAEGFIQRTKSNSLENVAEGYLMDLITRSLVIITQSKSNGGVKSCCVHDLLHEFSKGKAKDRNFFLISKEMHYDPEQYQKCFYYGDKFLCGWMPCDPYVRSVVFYPIKSRNFWDKTFVPSVISYSLKLLRVLDLQHITLVSRDFQTVTELLVHLRYFACSIQGRLNHIPSSVGNLWRLETLLVKTMCGMEVSVKLPETLLEMPYLKHVCVSDEAAFELPHTFETEKSFESGIEKFSTLLLHLDDGTTEKLIRRLQSLRKLKCILLESLDQNRDCIIQFPALHLLSKLESLNVTYRSRMRISEFSLPLNLKKLTLSWFGLPWSEISKIGRLPQLKVLKLLHNAFKGQRWDVSDDEFQNLKFLKLEWLDIMEWNATPYAFPSLEQLVLKRCKDLKEVPLTFAESSTLQMIEAKWCRNSVTEAVHKIKEEQDGLGASGFKVLI